MQVKMLFSNIFIVMMLICREKTIESDLKKAKLDKNGDKPNGITLQMTATELPPLPTELWLHIFQDVVKIAGPLPFLCRYFNRTIQKKELFKSIFISMI